MSLIIIICLVGKYYDYNIGERDKNKNWDFQGGGDSHHKLKGIGIWKDML